MIFLLIGFMLGTGISSVYYEQEPKRLFMRDGKVYQVQEILYKEQVQTEVDIIKAQK